MKQTTYDTIARVLPFGLYMLFIAAAEIPTLWGGSPPSPQFMLRLYPVKIVLVTAALVAFRKSYTDMDWKSLGNIGHSLLSAGVGVAVFVAWIQLDTAFAVQGELTSYDPTIAQNSAERLFLIFGRVLGAAVCVPIMEELFWKSFLARYLIHKNFMKVRAGTYTVFTFLATAVLFGLEHQLLAAGIFAGLAFNFIYWKTGSLAQCILSHGVTNLILALYVLVTGAWYFW